MLGGAVPPEQTTSEARVDATVDGITEPSGMLLFCLAYSKASAQTLFKDWGGALAKAGITIVPVEHPERVCPTIDTLDAATDALVRVLSLYPPSTRYALYGHSYGALLAYAVARQLSDLGRPPIRLFVGAFSSPAGANPLMASMTMPCFEALHYSSVPRALSRMDALLLQGALGQLYFERTSTERIIEGALAAFHANSAGGFATPITALRGTDDPVVSASEMEAWAALTAGTFECVPFEGDHFFLHKAQSQPAMLELIAARLGARP